MMGGGDEGWLAGAWPLCLARMPCLMAVASLAPALWHPQTKPVIASMSDVAASGGFYMAMAAKKVGTRLWACQLLHTAAHKCT